MVLLKLGVMSFQQLLIDFLAVRTDPYRQAREWKASHQGKVIAYLFPDVPEEILHASGSLPMAILGLDRSVSLSDSHIPSFICSPIRNAFEIALDGGLDFIDGMVIPYVCDSTRAFSQVWEANFPDLFNHTLWLPKRCDVDSAKRFLLSEFHRLKERLGDSCGREITNQHLARSIGIYNQNRKLLRQLFSLRRERRISIPYADCLAIVKSSMVMAKEDHNTRLLRLLTRLRGPGERHFEEAPVRVFLFGTLGEPDSILSLFDEVGIDVVDDHLYNGTRYFLQDVAKTIDPIEGLVNRHLSKDPLSGFHYPQGTWRQYFTKRVRENHVEGLIYFAPKYCDPLEFDYPLVKTLLGEMDIPVLFLETDLQSGSLGQARTRIEAFAEMLRERKDEAAYC